MSRLATSLVVLAAAAGSGSAFAADWNASSPEDIYRGAYTVEPQDWTEFGDDSDGVHMETGLRYWYSMGSQSHNIGSAGDFESSDTAHTLEAHIRIEDDATATYGKAWAGYTAAISGTYSDPYASADIVDGVLGYAGADFGWNAMSDGKGNGAGIFVGYNYWNNSPRTSRANYADPGSVVYDDQTGVWSIGGASVDDRIELNMLRLGVSGKTKISDYFDLSAEVAAVPFATISGVIGGHAIMGTDGPGQYPGCSDPDPALCAPYFFKTSPTEINGWGYGAMAEVMAGITPVENITFRVGGRAWYVGGTYDATYSGAEVTPPQYTEVGGVPADPPYVAPTVSTEDYIETSNPFSLFRYGLLAEMTYQF